MTDATLPPTPDEEREAASEELGPLDRREKESPEQHRGFLLWAMQDPRLGRPRRTRSKRAVARALARDESTVRYWARRSGCEWNKRVKGVAVDIQAFAMREYRRLYLTKAGRVELDVIRPLLSVTMYPEGDPAPPASAAALPDPQAKDGEAGAGKARGAQASTRQREEEQLRKQGLMYDAVIARAARDIQSGKMKVNAKDLPFIFGARDRVQRRLDELAGNVQTVQNVRIPESFRVRQARASGGNVMEALAGDAHDLALTLQAITNQTLQDDLTAARLIAERARMEAARLHEQDGGEESAA